MVTNVLSEKGTLFAKCWFFAGIIFLSIASTKRTLYLMPIFAPIAMLTAAYIDSTLKSPQSLTTIGKIFHWVFTIVLLFVGLALTPVCFVYEKALSHGCVRNAFDPDYRLLPIYDSALYCSHKIFSARETSRNTGFQ